MSDPQPAPTRKQPPRAQPLQPDAPGRGDGPAATDDDGRAGAAAPAPATAPDDAAKNAEQEKTALDNVRDGYR